MNNQKKIGLIGGMLLLMMLLVWGFSNDNGTEQQKKEKHRKIYTSSNWNKRFQPYGKSPQGLYLFNTLLKAHIDTSNSVQVIQNWIELDSLIANDTLPKTYLFVGNGFGLRDKEIDAIEDEIKKGSRLFLSYNGFTENIYPTFFDDYSEKFDYDDEITVFSATKSYKMINLYQNDTLARKWRAFGELTTPYNFKSLSSFMELSNFIKMEIENGYAYFHTNPTLFYNYQIKRKQGYQHAEFVINQLPKSQDIILLELARLTDSYGNHDVDDQSGAEGKTDDSYLRVIFESPMLLRAFILSIVGLIFFLIFRSKRVRPIVPYIGKKKDMTLAFAETITSIYFAKRNPYGLLQIQKRNFYQTVRKHFFVDLERREGERAIEVLAEKSNTPFNELQNLIAEFETTKAFGVTEQSVAQTAKKKLDFYTRTGIVSQKLVEKIDDKQIVFRKALLIPSFMMLTGVFLIIFGFYYLMSAVGIGVVFWPLGLFSVFLGVVRISKPFLIVEKDEIIYFTPFGKEKHYSKEAFISVEKKKSGAVINFTENRQIIISDWDLSRFDKRKFDQFMIKLQTEQL